ncbi:hypothetical protein ASF06_03575 [Agreia sp. Leaf244]|uniref:alpha/beta hydrolase fold domain-containing protein n=1 Tax=Agreia sp. Leaf244 TaxID=1736305 RepID=UPI0006F32A2B|nr:alpha/beta hydrolase fold domain-containing protein [Agreia sp. Leaf244]KQO11718.1 hypothetical protein ASF06_03575 [Agreia sp. Leaf244]
MPLDPFYVTRFEEVAGFDRDRAARSDPDTRRRIADYRAPTEYDVPAAVDLDEVVITGRHGPIPLRRYRGGRGGATTRTVLWVHGGGFSQGALDWPESHVVAAELAARACADVVSVGYRLAVDGVRYPVPLDDVHDAAEWLTTTAPSGAAVALGGASAGASLALATAQRLRDTTNTPAALLLAYPLVHFPVPALEDDEAVAVARILPPMLRFPPRHVEAIMRNYVGRLHDLPAHAVPGSGDLEGLPMTHIVVAEYDELRPSGELLARQLGDAGVPVAIDLASGVPHGHLNRTPSAPEVSSTLAALAATLRAL